jgi:hypothetical protein
MIYPHVPAAFINAIAEEGTKAEAIEYLQKQWNETCALRAELTRLYEKHGYAETARVLGLDR